MDVGTAVATVVFPSASDGTTVAVTAGADPEKLGAAVAVAVFDTVVPPKVGHSGETVCVIVTTDEDKLNGTVTVAVTALGEVVVYAYALLATAE